MLEPKRQLPIFSQEEIQLQTRADIEKIINLCDTVINNLFQDTLLAFYAIKNDARPDAAQIKMYVLIFNYIVL